MDATGLDRLRSEWTELLRSLAVPEAAAAVGFDELAAAYAETGRAYHNLDHVAAVLDTVAGLADAARDLAAVRLAAWFHDAVYDPRVGDNEERSAALAEERCLAWGIPRTVTGTVVRLILATKTHQADDGDRDALVLLDADLAILGAPPDEYDRYSRAIRQEYAWVPEEDYRQGRVKILRSFLRRRQLFRLEKMRALREAAARDNLGREAAALGG